jgi:toxin ParE1/3/4
MTFEFHPEAARELRDDALFYESRRTGLGREFRDAVRRLIARAMDEPLRWRPFEAGTRRAVMGRFPYVVIYLVEKEAVLIVAVMHCSREPGYWRERIEGAE